MNSTFGKTTWHGVRIVHGPTPNLGVALAGRGQVDKAVAHYRKALEITPGYEVAHYNLGLALAGRREDR